MSTPSPTTLIKATLLAVSMLTVMAGATIAPALPAMAKQFAGSANVELLVRLILTIPGLAIAIAGPLAGFLTDRVGRRPVIVVSTLLYAVAGTSGAFLDSLPALLASRALLGLAVAGIMTTSIALIADLFEGPARATFLGIQGSFMAYGGVVFLIAGGALADLSWRGPFFIYLLSLPIAAAVLFALREPEQIRHAVAEQAPPFPWGRLVPVYAIAFVGMVIFFMLPVQLPFLLERITGAPPSLVGLALALGPLTAGTVALFYGRVKARLSFLAIIAIIFGLIGAGYVVIGNAGSYLAAVPGLLVAGAGVGFLLPNSNVWVVAVAPEALRGRALGGLTTALYLGQFVSPLLIQPQLLGGLSAGFRLIGLGVAVAGVALATLLLIAPRRAAAQPR